MRKLILYPVVILTLIVLFSCGSEGAKTKVSGDDISGDLIVFHAGSLSVPFKEMAQAFEKEHPSVNVQLEAAGSVACARKITDLDRECDVFGSADYRVIDEMLIPDYADWNLQFAGNEISIVYNEKSRLADKINSKNWYEILQDDNVAFGRSDPNADPCGYRTVLSMKLAEKLYKIDGLADDVLSKDTKYIRPKEVDLIALLELGAIDYMFIYTSVAVQHTLKYIELPDSINLSNPKLAGWYRQVSTEINGKKPGDKITFYGEPIVYGATILRDAPNPKAALAFVKFMVSPEKGLAIMKKNGQTVIDPPVSGQMEKVPEELMNK
ncbi:MAG: tungstate ABC transporter substrate-binding protein WtpA [Bacteroidales bacterium]|nr:tungstate ABC transporter substrate-binding protein WtpA [Bacteroidales bacterium]MCF8458024.1 tungstate ABC transporter substrate-binding protein WtpA [Bacteroidales bacterium]